MDKSRELKRNIWKMATEDAAERKTLRKFLRQIKQNHIWAFYSDLAKRDLAANTIKLCHSLIYLVLDIAVDSDIIRKNPAKDGKKVQNQGNKKYNTGKIPQESPVHK